MPKSPQILFPITSFSLIQSKLLTLGLCLVVPGMLQCPFRIIYTLNSCGMPRQLFFLRNSEQKLPQRANYPYLQQTAQRQAGITSTSTSHLNILHRLWHSCRLHPRAASRLMHKSSLLQSCLLPATAMAQKSWHSQNSVLTVFGLVLVIMCPGLKGFSLGQELCWLCTAESQSCSP